MAGAILWPQQCKAFLTIYGLLVRVLYFFFAGCFYVLFVLVCRFSGGAVRPPLRRPVLRLDPNRVFANQTVAADWVVRRRPRALRPAGLAPRVAGRDRVSQSGRARWLDALPRLDAVGPVPRPRPPEVLTYNA